MDEPLHPSPSRAYGVLSGFVLLVLGGIGAVIWANAWKGELRVNEVCVEGNRTVTSEEILSAAAIHNAEKLYDVDLFAVAQRVQQNHFVKSVSVQREVPSRITISVIERIPVAAVMLNQLMYVDSEGYVLPSVVSENIFDIPVLTGTLPRDELIPGRRVSSASLKEAISVLTQAERIDEQLYRRISEVHIDGKSDLVFFTAEAGVPVIIGHDDIGVKLVKFDSFWKQQVDQRGARDLQYIDLRFQDQVVVKWNQDKGVGQELRSTRTM